ncbi:hypothetical protein ED733_001703 [Metarhizium rileyi]|uniref:Uncharacterized protein n=1 Tax=Metarhizium rileyi (strain RCEF 4871) TaxID=1649241 RepID=A0A5C6FZX3_METRR|nr:hypothetical protein ED733_001703 [Metarhizium rileyi]
MRLINCSTLKLEEFVGEDIPPYAILSHTWQTEEVLLGDISGAGDKSHLKGFQKVVHTCRLANTDGYKYAWVDTCCIDKSSSAELTEAINSMFNWYRSSGRCYAYLCDFDSRETTSNFSRCRWFTRGWTLQELVAPSDIRFYDMNWEYFGSKSELWAALSAITGIDRPILDGTSPLFMISTAKKMSWAAYRQTSRVEDVAYCLLGIFGISMPLVYGEGARAFARLQEEIMKESNDLTLFAWQAELGDSASYRGVLARSPREFANAGDVISSTSNKSNAEFAMTNKGLRIQSALSRGPCNSLVMPLNCHQGTGGHNPIGIYLVDIGGGVYVRDLPQKLAPHITGEVLKNEIIYIMRHISDIRYL